jgi:hypothetical protein
VTIDSFFTPSQLGGMTSPSSLGPDNPPPSGEATEASFTTFDDIDDLNNHYIIDSSFKGISGVYRTNFAVSYVNPSNLSQVSTTRTFIKRVDMSIWRTNPPGRDTLRHSIIVGYFHFD